MIFVTLGTQKFRFNRFVEYLDRYIKDSKLDEEVVIQSGFTVVESEHLKVYDFMSKEAYEEKLSKCRVLITHAGVGSIINGLKKGKKIIVMPRMKKYDEHIDDHQFQIATKFSQLGYILSCNSYDEFVYCIENVDSFVSSYDSLNQKASLQMNLLEYIKQNFNE